MTRKKDQTPNIVGPVRVPTEAQMLAAAKAAYSGKKKVTWLRARVFNDRKLAIIYEMDGIVRGAKEVVFHDDWLATARLCAAKIKAQELRDGR